jgi:hypothetical protein
MLFGINARYLTAGVTFVRHERMAADAQVTTAINVQTNRVFGVIVAGTMTVFTTNGSMAGVLNVIVLIFVAFYTNLCSLILHPDGFPFCLIRYAVPAIHVSALIDAEIIGN